MYKTLKKSQGTSEMQRQTRGIVPIIGAGRSIAHLPIVVKKGGAK